MLLTPLAGLCLLSCCLVSLPFSLSTSLQLSLFPKSKQSNAKIKRSNYHTLHCRASVDTTGIHTASKTNTRSRSSSSRSSRSDSSSKWKNSRIEKNLCSRCLSHQRSSGQGRAKPTFLYIRLFYLIYFNRFSFLFFFFFWSEQFLPSRC